jgi:hypothetical protein
LITNGTGRRTLFAALDMLTGNVIGKCEDHHTAKEYIAFLKKLDKTCEKGIVPHIIGACRTCRFLRHFVPQKPRYRGSLRSLRSKKSPDRRFFRDLSAKCDKLLGYCTKYSYLLKYSHVSHIGKHQNKPNSGGSGLRAPGSGLRAPGWIIQMSRKKVN